MMLNKMLLQWLMIDVAIQLAHALFGPQKMHSNLTSRLMLLLARKLELSLTFLWAFHDVMLRKKVHHACALALKHFALEAAKARLVLLNPLCTRMAYF